MLPLVDLLFVVRGQGGVYYVLNVGVLAALRWRLSGLILKGHPAPLTRRASSRLVLNKGVADGGDQRSGAGQGLQRMAAEACCANEPIYWSCVPVWHHGRQADNYYYHY